MQSRQCSSELQTEKAVLYLACRRSPLSCGVEEQSRTGQLSVAVLVTEISQTASHVSIPTDREQDGEGVVVISKLDESEPRRYRAASTDTTCTSNPPQIRPRLSACLAV